MVFSAYKKKLINRGSNGKIDVIYIFSALPFVHCLYINTYVHTGISAYKDHQLQQSLVDGWAEIFRSCQWLWMPLCPYTLGHIFICSDKTQLQMKAVKSAAG